MRSTNDDFEKCISEILNNACRHAPQDYYKSYSIKPLNKDIKKTVDTVSKNILMEK